MNKIISKDAVKALVRPVMIFFCGLMLGGTAVFIAAEHWYSGFSRRDNQVMNAALASRNYTTLVLLRNGPVNDALEHLENMLDADVGALSGESALSPEMVVLMRKIQEYRQKFPRQSGSAAAEEQQESAQD